MLPWFEPCSRPDGEPCDCCWTWNDFSLATDDEAMLQRRLSMWTILAVRTMMSILRIFYHLNGTSVVLWITWDVVSGVADFSLAGLALSSISKVKGQRKVPMLGTYMNRRRFDISLFVLAIVQVTILMVSLEKPSYDTMGMVWLAIPKIIASQPKEELVVKS
ncbi:hypothetical protein MRS44_007171 [Fusarium solani]|uniref:Uncharacterized protein n=1 Tax=Fusarium solani TaxID=169388 RepID=A0A9P9KE02_FUSSL|nr:uncharacterized protein B0J15DRAFT_497895 [Fusarium solani]KAH7249539.1 hypothetical protein B0J15DRAFT_497895 [Fusarium solani]KAJ3462385.1 hypothetical protein MRS44_007171 [Fusarium solani]